MGSVWAYSFSTNTTPKTTVITVYITDTESDALFWQREIPVGLVGGPYILNKGLMRAEPNLTFNTC
jgi:hypothetical protein